MKNFKSIIILTILFFGTFANINNLNAEWEINLAKKYWILTQWSQYDSNSSVYNIIDWDISTFNHTHSGDNNWLQIYVPWLISISKINVQSRNWWEWRLQNAKIYILNNPYSWNISDLSNLTANWVLQWTRSKQEFVFDPAVNWKYVLIKADTGKHLHIAEAEVYGTTSNKPIFNSYKKSFLISISTRNNTDIAKIDAIDYQGDNINYSLISSQNLPFKINSSWSISTNSARLIAWTYSFKVKASDWVNFSETSDIKIKVTKANAVENAILSWDTTEVTQGELIQAVLDEIEWWKNTMLGAKIKIFNLNQDWTAKSDNSSLTNINWDPSHDSSTFLSNSRYLRNYPILYTNAANWWRTAYKNIIWVIWSSWTWNYIVLWWNPFRNSVNGDMNKFLENSISWLTDKNDLKTWTWFNVVLSHLDNSQYFRDETKTREWLDSHYPNKVSYNSENSCDNTALEWCLRNADLLIISQVSNNSDNLEAVINSVNNALSKWIPVIYIHNDWDLKNLWRKLFSDVFDVKYERDNYWLKIKLEWYNPIWDVWVFLWFNKKVRDLFTHFKNNDYNIDLSSQNTTWLKEFRQQANAIRDMFSSLDSSKIDIFSFDKNSYRLAKLLILNSDKFRQSVVFPMDRITTDNNEFLKSYYSDHAVYNYRKINPAQNDMWNFSRSDFSHITPTNSKTISYKSKRPFRAAWVYAIPWKTFKVTRNDNSDSVVKIFINSLRNGSTHEFDPNWYNRPKFLQTTHIDIKSWETIELTSSYGWPIQIEFSKNELDIELKFENVWEHPYWNKTEDNKSFTDKLNAWEYDWAEISTTWFEVHSKLENMKNSVAWWGTPELLAKATVKYISNYPLVLAGFKWPWIDVVDEIHNFATKNNLVINYSDQVKHMNADQATCWYWCSWNPYDAYWAFSPVWHWDIHEVWHWLEKWRFKFKWWEWHSLTNPYSYYTKSQYNKITSEDPVCQNLPFEDIFDNIKISKSKENPISYLQNNYWNKSQWNSQFMVQLQAMMHAEKMWKLEDGWHFLARLHILERNIWNIKWDWENKKANIGFSNYSLDEFNSISNDDWNLISYSFLTWLDYTDYLKMMWIVLTQKAIDQVKSFNYDKVPQELFVSTPNGYCKKDKYWEYLSKPSIKMTSDVVWPANIDVCTNWDNSWNLFDGTCDSKNNSESSSENNNNSSSEVDSEINLTSYSEIESWWNNFYFTWSLTWNYWEIKRLNLKEVFKHFWEEDDANINNIKQFNLTWSLLTFLERQIKKDNSGNTLVELDFWTWTKIYSPNNFSNKFLKKYITFADKNLWNNKVKKFKNPVKIWWNKTLILDKPFTIRFKNSWTPTAKLWFKKSEENQWNLREIESSSCKIVFPNECSYRDWNDVVVKTFHFTDFTIIDEVIIPNILESNTTWGWRRSTPTCKDEQLVCTKSWDYYKFTKKTWAICINGNLGKTCEMNNVNTNKDENNNVGDIANENVVENVDVNINENKEGNINVSVDVNINQNQNIIKYKTKKEIYDEVKSNISYINYWGFQILEVKGSKYNELFNNISKKISDKKNIWFEDKKILINKLNNINILFNVFKNRYLSDIDKNYYKKKLLYKLNNFISFYKEIIKNKKVVSTFVLNDKESSSNPTFKNGKNKVYNSYLFDVNVWNVQLKEDLYWKKTNALLKYWDIVEQISLINKYWFFKVRVIESIDWYEWIEWYIYKKHLKHKD